MSKATDKFKSNPLVKEYYEKATENQQIMNGMRDVDDAPVTAPVPEAANPSELAKPAE